MNNWQRITDTAPDDDRVVETKIHDADGARNEQPLRRIRRLWFFPDKSMYVYYQPTHYREALEDRA